MLDHFGFTASDYNRSRAFFEKALAPLGFAIVMEVGPEETGGSRHAGFGPPGRPHFWIGDAGAPTSHFHMAFAAENRVAVDAFYAAALTAGASDNGAPGLRPHYHPDYYGAFVLDPDGHNIEAVCHRPE